MPRPRMERKPRRGQRDMTSPVHERSWEVGTDEHGARLDAFLAARIRWRSRTGVQQLIREGVVEVRPFKDPQQAPVGALREGLRLRVGQQVVVRLPEPGAESGSSGAVPAVEEELGEVEVLYEDEQILAVNKPPHLHVHPSRGHLTGSLIHRIHARQRARQDDGPRPTLCHRLDRETSGLVLCAKDQLSRSRLGRQFEARTVKKAYLAWVVGEVADEEGDIDLPLGKALASRVRLKMAVRHDSDGQPSRTRWKVVRRVPGRTLLELRPETGRQHQLRVHLAALGHPVLGDKLYMGDEEIFIRHVQGGLTLEDRQFLRLDRHALHSWRLSFEHPFTGRATTLEAPLWEDLDGLLA